MLPELKSRGVTDVCIVCCDRLSELPDAIRLVWPQAVVQTCVVHLIRQPALRLQRDWTAPRRNLRSFYTASDEASAATALEVFAEGWRARYRALRACASDGYVGSWGSWR